MFLCKKKNILQLWERCGVIPESAGLAKVKET